MNIVFLIGNGFDLNFHIKTKYIDFYKYYINQGIVVDIKDENKKKRAIDSISAFKDELAENLENWADLEIELGRYVKNFNKETEEEFIALLDDIQDNLAEYIDEQDKNFTISEVDKKKIFNDLISFEDYLLLREKEDFLSYKNQFLNSSYEVEVITFNYTRTFEKISGWRDKPIDIGNRVYGQESFSQRIKSVNHIHGTTESNMILGVNDISQIENEELKKSIETIRAMVKTEINRNAGTLRDRYCTDNIKKADIICVFGMSIGATDKYWWQAIVNRLQTSKCRLLIFSKSNQIRKRREYRAQNLKDEIVNRLLSYSKLADTEIQQIRNKIFVCLNSAMFNATLNYEEENIFAKKVY